MMFPLLCLKPPKLSLPYLLLFEIAQSESFLGNLLLLLLLLVQLPHHLGEVLVATDLSLVQFVVDVQFQVLLVHADDELDVFDGLSLHLGTLFDAVQLDTAVLTGDKDFVVETVPFLLQNHVVDLVHARLVLLLPIPDALHVFLSIFHNLGSDHFGTLLPFHVFLEKLGRADAPLMDLSPLVGVLGCLSTTPDLLVLKVAHSWLALLLGWSLLDLTPGWPLEKLVHLVAKVIIKFLLVIGFPLLLLFLLWRREVLLEALGRLV
jgi:hypothetical protein